MKATEQDFPVVLFIMLYRMVLVFESVESMKSLSVKKNYRVILFHGAAHYAVQGG